MNSPLQFAIIGCGKIAPRHAAEAAKLGKLAAVCDIIPVKADAVIIFRIVPVDSFIPNTEPNKTLTIPAYPCYFFYFFTPVCSIVSKRAEFLCWHVEYMHPITRCAPYIITDKNEIKYLIPSQVTILW